MSDKNKHMDYEDRLEIQECLNKGMTFKAIGERIGKYATTVLKEVKRHLKNYRNGFVKTDEVCRKCWQHLMSAMAVNTGQEVAAGACGGSTMPNKLRKNIGLSWWNQGQESL